MIRGFCVFLSKKPRYNGTNDRNEVRRMSKIIFNEIQMKQLEKNKNVVKASERSISYCSDFKVRAAKENQQGKGPSQIFLENGFDLAVIGEEKPKQCLKR